MYKIRTIESLVKVSSLYLFPRPPLALHYIEPWHEEVSWRNRNMMEELRATLMVRSNMALLKHIKPSDEAEIEEFFGLPEILKLKD